MGKQLLNIEDEDLATLFPSETYLIGGKIPVTIQPLGLEDLVQIGDQLAQLGNDMTAQGVTFTNYKGKLHLMANIIVKRYPGIVSVMSGVTSETLSKLPAAEHVAIMVRCLAVNFKDQEAFVKNLETLLDQLTQVTETLVSTRSDLAGSSST